MKKIHPSKTGAALLIALGFLAVLTILIIAFSAQTRTERLSGRAYLTTAQTRQLLHTALSRAMAEIDNAAGTNYPAFFALGSPGNTGLLNVEFETETDYFQHGNASIGAGFAQAINTARWDTVFVDGIPVGRVGFVVVNSSGLLDANAAGGLDAGGGLAGRNAGLSPKEIQLDPELLPELGSSGERIAADGSKSPADSPAQALVHNRDTAWRRFESLRDFTQLNAGAYGNLVQGDPASFATFSYRPGEDLRSFMGTNSATLDRALVRGELEENPAIDADFVLNQLVDYLDTDTVPEDIDRSVEPVPLINELALVCNFSFYPEIETNDDGTEEVTSVIISNNYSLNLEVWYPFTGYTNEMQYNVNITNIPLQTALLPEDLFGPITTNGNTSEIQAWQRGYDIPLNVTFPGSDPEVFTVYSAEIETTVSSSDEMVGMFEEMESDVQFPLIVCTDGNGDMVDRVMNLELPLATVVPNRLLPYIGELSTNLFDVATATETSNRFVVAKACIDPRLNSDGESLLQWQEDVELDENAQEGTLGDINYNVISNTVFTQMFVRNSDRIDTPYEFTYFLYDTSKPWKTIQMLDAYDDDDTRYIMQNLSPFPRGAKPRQGLVNPYSPNPDVLASVFMDMPLDEFNGARAKRLGKEQATEAARLFMEQVANAGWPTNAAEYGQGIDLDALEDVVGSDNPWIMESFMRNTYELFNPRDTLYTILLTAQAGTDADGDGMVSDDEVSGTQQAVVYVWRDPQTGKAATVFYGLTDTLRSTMAGGESWGSLLDAFKPDS